MDRQREVSRAFTTGRGPLRILYINSTSANGKQQKRTNRARNQDFVGIEVDAGRSSSARFGSRFVSDSDPARPQLGPRLGPAARPQA